MRHVYLVASKSKDPRTKIGAVLVRDNTVISEGYNGFPRYVLDLEERYLLRELKSNYVIHAENNSILNCARNGISTLGTTLYTQGTPCKECAKSIIQAGIKTYVIHSKWPNLTYSSEWTKSIIIANQMFKEAGINEVYIDSILNLTGFLDGKIINI